MIVTLANVLCHSVHNEVDRSSILYVSPPVHAPYLCSCPTGQIGIQNVLRTLVLIDAFIYFGLSLVRSQVDV